MRNANLTPRSTRLGAMLAIAASALFLACGGKAIDPAAPDGSTGAGNQGGDNGGSSSGGGGEDANAGQCNISASSYDQSCAVDYDCVTVTSGDYCTAICECGGSTINQGALATFNAAVAKTPLGSGALGAGAGDCPCAPSPYGGPCCRNSACTQDCGGPKDTLPACADAGGSCVLGTSFLCSPTGPANSCAYPDQVCCG
jgi:hypothetical protein